MFGQYPTPRGGIGNTTPRLPPISSPSLVNDQSALALLDQTYAIQANMQSITDERRARQMLEEQVRVITLVCKKLNQDIEALDTQLGERNVLLNSIEFRSNELQSNNISLNKDLQFKLARHDSSLSKLENESVGFNNVLKELQNRQAEGMRTLGFRLNEIESRINDLNSKFDSILMEHTMVLKNVEGDTIKQLQMIDGKTRTMLEDVRSQMYQSKATQEAEMSRLESRLTLKIDDSVRNNEKFERLDRKFEEYSQSSSKRFMTIEEEFQRTLNRLANSNEKLDHKINKTLEDRVLRSNNDYEKLKREMKIGFENIQDSILSLQNLIDGKIKLSEDRLEKEIEKIRKMVVLI